MQTIREHMVRAIEAKARLRTGQLASQLVRAAPADKEEILAAFEFERWLTESCSAALNREPD